ncbi:hypothetical protein [Sphingobium sp.]|uniref:hypothetical protein n=1 Tax=Sphingobium sp. TaxID=1912891 RepID=UPI002B70FD63|nr:hypothetical protein [Sphingobium sp.]HUD94873.1 hypothetical protein [Sphingobium sp.]
MDRKVAALLDELSRAKGIDPIGTRHRIAALLGEVRGESDRVALLGVFAAVMAQAVRTLEAESRDAAALKTAIRSDMRGFAIEEAMAGSEAIDPPTLQHVVAREVAAGRLEDGRFARLASTGAAVMGSAAPVSVRQGFLRKLLECED